MLAAGFAFATVGFVLVNRSRSTATTTTTTNDQNNTSVSTTSAQPLSVDEIDSELDDLLQSALATVIPSNLKYVHAFYDVQKEYSEECECEFGFKRPDFKQGSMIGRVTFHDKHIFVLTKMKANEWDKDFDKQGFAMVLKKGLSKNLKGVRCKVSYAEAVDGEDAGDDSNYNILVLPDMIKYVGVNESNVDQVAQDLKSGTGSSSFKKEKIDASQIFICAHAKKDMRCGVCGPRLYQAFAEQLPQSSIADKKIDIRRCTHVGGHKYAGNLIIYQEHRNRKVFGDWYGYVEEKDVARLIDEHLANNQIVKDLWRGRCGLSQELSEKFLQFN